MAKPKVSEEERAALAQKLDDELDCFMDELAQRKQTEGTPKKPFNFDEWCKEIDQHPAFMTDLKAGADGEHSEFIQALQAMKYDDGETEEDRQLTAEGHKNEGNKHFKLKKYRWAITAYTNGVKVMCTNKKLNAVLYANRAAANRYLGNLRSVIRDCVIACKFDPTNGKAVVRCAECFVELGYGREAVDWINKCLPHLAKPIEGVDDSTWQSQVKQLREISSVAIKKQEEQEKDERKEKLLKKKDDQKKMAYMKAFKERNLKFQPRLHYDVVDLFDWSHLSVQLAQIQTDSMVHLDKAGHLHWPILLQYPEHGQTDMLSDCWELSELKRVVKCCLETPEEWGRHIHYKMSDVRFFVVLDVYDDIVVKEVSGNDKIKSILQTKDYKITWGLPVIQVYNTAYAKKSLELLENGRFRVK
ncbi:hypothetical protein QR680_009100 [Steinernema hermaphroditum]|uniref:Cns1/TTC4 wheel domain-containing protein n=1 Tax=Steinernema hermaphroditum TaxID=289476 RepID=A0AA39IKG9_9BILA|nr:hypothetical protein QR680_009100 [Steinernema hermaphroditum]